MITSNKHIAKNSILLLFKQTILLFIGLYTTRTILNTLGVQDFGIYNIVGGVIVLFSFISSAMNRASSRFFAIDLGRGDFNALKKTFGLSICIHICLAVIILFLGETFGLWFLNNKLNIPCDRMDAANFIYQFSILSACVAILQIPYSSAIQAHEKFSFITGIGIVESVLKLCTVFLLILAPFDKLKLYSVLLFSVFLAIFICYLFYSRKYFQETRSPLFFNKEALLKRLKFSAWMFLGSISGILVMQGTNMLLNIFYGVFVNAAIGIMTQVSGTLQTFICNFLVPFQPQIIKSYAKSNIDHMHSLVTRACKFSVLLCLLFLVPFLLNMDFVLHLWLKNVPEYVTIFCQIQIIVTCMDVLRFPLSMSIEAKGKMSAISIVNSGILFLQFALSYILLSRDATPVVVPILSLVIIIFSLIEHLIFTKILLGFSIRNFLTEVLLRIAIIAAVSLPLPIWASLSFEGWHKLLLSTGAFLLVFAPSAFFFGLTKHERVVIVGAVRGRF